jgi:hypothetical protein
MPVGNNKSKVYTRPLRETDQGRQNKSALVAPSSVKNLPLQWVDFSVSYSARFNEIGTSRKDFAQNGKANGRPCAEPFA